jgi:hypothetical protein
MEAKLGKTIYSITSYEKVKRAVIPIGKDGDFVLMVSFDNEADHDLIIRNKIMPLVSSHHQKYSKKSSCCVEDRIIIFQEGICNLFCWLYYVCVCVYYHDFLTTVMV